MTSATGDTTYSARLVARLLQIAGREDIPVGVGIPQDPLPKTHAAWLGEYRLGAYHGRVFEDGVGAICETVMVSPQPVTIVCIGPLPNIAAALEREPQIVHNSRFVGMHGSLRRGYLGLPKPMREYNAFKHPQDCQKIFRTPWDISITPLDTCGTVTLEGDEFARVKASNDPLTQALMENHFAWCDAVKTWPMMADLDPQRQSSRLYDTAPASER